VQYVAECPMSNTTHSITKEEMRCALYRRLDEPHADRLLYTPRTTEWIESSQHV